MILVGNQRAGARDLALHLLKDENDHVHVHEIKGFVATDLMGAFKETEAIAKGTKCRQFLFSLSLNPPEHERCTVQDFEKAIDKVEVKLGLTDQPRAIVFHEKEGRRHCHTVWSRIDTDTMKAIQLSHSKKKLISLSKELYLTHGWRLPAGHIDRKLSDPRTFTLAEWQQAKRNGQDPREIKEALREAWSISDDQASLTQVLKERGYALAHGNRRSIVVVDRFGEIYALPRQLKLKTKQVKARITEPDELRPVDNVKAEIDQRIAKSLTTFAGELETEQKRLKQDYQDKLHALRERQRKERSDLMEMQKQRRETEAVARSQRFRRGLKGLWDVLRGEHARITKENKQDAAACLKRDHAEFHAKIERHLDERKAMKVGRSHAIAAAKEIQIQRIDLLTVLDKNLIFKTNKFQRIRLKRL
ncbi:MAG: relaxase/mobilization nuclease domain-containing protein [Henriciella sp.]|nr:relaxase/mobilization nuclease domain-containing protein [Henriciella sp.]